MTTHMETDDVDDIEFGCQVWSTTHQDSQGWVGGVVIDIDDESRTVTVLPNVVPSRGPEPLTLALDELAVDATKFDTRNAGVAAIQLFGYLGTLTTDRQRRRGDSAKWGAIAVRLQALVDAGPNLPGAENRYQRWRASRSAS